MSDTKATNRPQANDNEQGYYYPLAQSKASNRLQKQMTVKITDPELFELLGNVAIESEDFRLFSSGYKELVNGVNQSAAMLLDSLMITATLDGLHSTLVKLPLTDYMSMRGLRDDKRSPDTS